MGCFKQNTTKVNQKGGGEMGWGLLLISLGWQWLQDNPQGSQPCVIRASGVNWSLSLTDCKGGFVKSVTAITSSVFMLRGKGQALLLWVYWVVSMLTLLVNVCIHWKLPGLYQKTPNLFKLFNYFLHRMNNFKLLNTLIYFETAVAHMRYFCS